MNDIHFRTLSVQERDNGKRIEISVVVPATEVSIIAREFNNVVAEAMGINSQGQSDLEPVGTIPGRFGEEQLSSMREDYFLNRFATAAIHQCDIESVTTPGVHLNAPYEEGSELSFTVSVVPRPSLTLTSIEPVKVKRAAVSVSDNDVDEQINYLARQFAEFRPVGLDSFAKGGWVSADVAIAKNGKRETNLSGLKRVIHVEPGEVPDEFINGITGIRKGETRKFSFDISNSSAADHYDVVITLKDVLECTVPSLDDSWIKHHLPQFESLACLRASIREDLERQKKRVDEQRFIWDVRAALEKRLVGEISDEMYEEAKEVLFSQVEKRLTSKGVTLEGYCQKHGVSKEEFNMNTFMQASQVLRQNLALDVLASEMNIEVSEQELTCEKHELPFSLASLSDEEFESRGLRRSLVEKIKRDKAMRWLLETAVAE